MAILDEKNLDPASQMKKQGSVSIPTHGGWVGQERETLGEVNKPTDTVQGQMTGLLGKNSQYMQRAQHKAMAAANSRGLLNSSIAAGAGTAAAIDSALPIAQQDAQTYSQQRLTNQDAANKFTAARNTTRSDSLLSRQDYGQKRTLQSDNYKQDLGRTKAAGYQDRLTARVNNAHQVAMQRLQGSQQERLANIESNWRMQIQQNASAGEFYTRMSESMTNIMNNKDLSAAQQQAAINKQLELLGGGLTLLGNINDMNLDLDFGDSLGKADGGNAGRLTGTSVPPAPQRTDYSGRFGSRNYERALSEWRELYG